MPVSEKAIGGLCQGLLISEAIIKFFCKPLEVTTEFEQIPWKIPVHSFDLVQLQAYNQQLYQTMEFLTDIFQEFSLNFEKFVKA